MDTIKETKNNDAYILEKLVEIGKKLDVTDSGMQLLKSDMLVFKDEVQQSIRNLGALIEHQNDRIAAIGEGVSFINNKIDRYYQEFKAYTEKQDAVNNATWFRLGKLEDRVFGNSEERFGDIAFA